LEDGQLLTPRGEALGLTGDLFGIDRVGLDTGTGVGLVIARSFERVLLISDLDLESLAGARLAGDRPERVESARLLFDLEGRGIADWGERLAWLLADQPAELSLEALDLGNVRLLARQQVLGLRHVRQPDGPELLLETRLGQSELGLHLGSAA